MAHARLSVQPNVVTLAEQELVTPPVVVHVKNSVVEHAFLTVHLTVVDVQIYATHVLVSV